jgi:polyhydroxyalkanoate synthesis repressor PhaR
MNSEKKPILIKKYPNRRLYNTDISDYVTLEDLYILVKNNIDFTVIDAKTGEDLTRLILTQIIFEQESKSFNILPINFLRQIIVFYDDSLRNVLPHYLESTMQSFAQNQDYFRNYSDNMNKALGTLSPFRIFEEITNQNMSLFQNSMKIFFTNQMNQQKKDD